MDIWRKKDDLLSVFLAPFAQVGQVPSVTAEAAHLGGQQDCPRLRGVVRQVRSQIWPLERRHATGYASVSGYDWIIVTKLGGQPNPCLVLTFDANLVTALDDPRQTGGDQDLFLGLGHRPYLRDQYMHNR